MRKSLRCIDIRACSPTLFARRVVDQTPIQPILRMLAVPPTEVLSVLWSFHVAQYDVLQRQRVWER